MLKQWIRALYGDNGVLTDYSIELQNNTSVTMPIVALQDYLYIGQSHPFNNIYVKTNVANTNSSVLSLQYWTTEGWINAVDILDATSLSGKTMAQPGVITWTPNINNPWLLVVDTSGQGTVPSELSTRTIYNLYWVRLKFSNDLSLTTSIKCLDYAFCNDALIDALDPDINEYLTNWKAGKTSWIDQILVASSHVVLDLKAKGFINSAANILRFDELYLATGYRTLCLIYSGLGEKFNDKKVFALQRYNDIINKVGVSVDQNNNAIAEQSEIGQRNGVMVR